jgi:hypothetical protein
MVGLQVE